MLNVQEVLEFIKNSDFDEFMKIKNAVGMKKSELARGAKSSFRVGDVVGINHKTIPQSDRFKIVKIMSKNIKVEKTNIPDGHVAGGIRVSPSLLVKK